jgi:hypothetical protein
MKIQDLLNISLDEVGINLLVSLPEPNKSPLAKANLKILLEACKTFRKLWGELVIDQITLPDIELKNMPKDMIVPTTKEEIWDSVFMTIFCYYNYSFFLIIGNLQHSDLPSGLNHDSIQSFLPHDVDKADDIYYIRILSFDYFMCLTSLYFIPMLRIPNMASGITTMTSLYHDSVLSIFQNCMLLTKTKRVTGFRILNSVLEYAKDTYSSAPQNKEYKPGIFSLIKTEELTLIASRDSKTVKQYGAKSIEKVFECQLALIMQSFGMYVVSTKIGIRTVDLICISSFPDKPYTFLIEAKTTNKSYSLPRKDFRALKEYVDDVRRTLYTLPPLRFVLISAYKPTKTLDNKLRELQADTGIPFRFISSQQIADLRENIIGLLPPDIFADKVLSSPYILEDDIVSEIEKKYTIMQKAHSDFIEAIFSAKGIVPNLKSRSEIEQ